MNCYYVKNDNKIVVFLNQSENHFEKERRLFGITYLLHSFLKQKKKKIYTHSFSTVRAEACGTPFPQALYHYRSTDNKRVCMEKQRSFPIFFYPKDLEKSHLADQNYRGFWQRQQNRHRLLYWCTWRNNLEIFMYQLSYLRKPRHARNPQSSRLPSLSANGSSVRLEFMYLRVATNQKL